MPNYGWSSTNQFWCSFDSEGYIVAQEFTGQFKRIGVSLQKFQQTEKIASEAMDKAEGYLKTLEEHGLIQRELTSDEKLAMLSTQMDALTRLVEQQAQMIGTLTAKREAVIPEIVPETSGDNQDVQCNANSLPSQIIISQ